MVQFAAPTRRDWIARFKRAMTFWMRGALRRAARCLPHYACNRASVPWTREKYPLPLVEEISGNTRFQKNAKLGIRRSVREKHIWSSHMRKILYATFAAGLLSAAGVTTAQAQLGGALGGAVNGTIGGGRS